MLARKFIVKGRVQGVFFRDSTRKQAEVLGLSGHAINLTNGDVEVLARGEPAAIAALAKWLETGPPFAKVRSVTTADIEGADDSDAARFTPGFRTG